MQLSSLLVLLASVYCASAINCTKGQEGFVNRVKCPPIKNMCSSQTFEGEPPRRWSMTCASQQECAKWKREAKTEIFDYRILCCYGDYCNDKPEMKDLFRPEFDEYTKSDEYEYKTENSEQHP